MKKIRLTMAPAIVLMAGAAMMAGGAQYYVDAAVSSSGDGTSWATAKKTIQEAAELNLLPGDAVNIQPGTYSMGFNPIHSGTGIVAVTTGVSVHGTTLTFPAGTSLAGVDLAGHPDEYYAYVYRSWRGNSGVYRITAVNAEARTVTLAGADFRDEHGASGDLTCLCAAIGRPIIFRNASDPAVAQVKINAPSEYTVIYIGDYINEYDAYPCDWNIIDGLEMYNMQGGGFHIQCSSYNVVMRCHIHDGGATGALVNGITARPALYTIFISNTIHNTSSEGIYNGAGGNPQNRNHTHYTHVLCNEFYSTGTHKYENAVDNKEYNRGAVIAGNYIHDTRQETGGNGLIDVQFCAADVLVYNNTIKNTRSSSNSDTSYILNVYDRTTNIFVFNNVIWRTNAFNDNSYALRVNGEQTMNVLIAFNTIHRIDRGILFEDYINNASPNGARVCNNIFSSIVDMTQTYEEWATRSGKFTVTNNFCSRDPGTDNSPYEVPAALTGDAYFANAALGDFNLTEASSRLINHASDTAPEITIDAGYEVRPYGARADIGAYEFVPEPAAVWLLALAGAYLGRRRA